MPTGADAHPFVMLTLAVFGWYIATRAAGEALPRFIPFAFRQALALWLPAAVVVLLAVVQQQPEVAVGVPFAASVAAVTLVLAVAGLGQVISVSGATQRGLWALLLPTAVLCLLIGFTGEVRPLHAGMLLLQGLAIACGIGKSQPEAAPASVAKASVLPSLQLLIALGVAGVASWLALGSARSISRDLEQSGGGLIAAVMFGPALVLPMIGSTSRMTSERRGSRAVDIIVIYVLLNLTVLLPLAALTWTARPYIAQALPMLHAGAATMPASAPASQPSGDLVRTALPYPISAWRIDTVLLIAAALLLLPLSLGKLVIARFEGLALLVAYAGYLMLTALAAR